jgi:hypothetical protein
VISPGDALINPVTGEISEFWMVEALPVYSDESWS